MGITRNHPIRTLACCIAFAGALLLCAAAHASAATPSQFLLAGHFGLNVNKTKVEAGASQQERDVCTVASGDECQGGEDDESGVPGGFYFAKSVAVNGQGDVYVVDTVNRRVQELGSDGAFIAMFGWNVNKTKVEEGAPQRERDICTAASGDECQNGSEGAGAGSPEELGYLDSIAIDQSTGDLYVLAPRYHRVEALTADGQFVWMAGEEVNETKDNTAGATEGEKNLCTAASGDTCKAGVASSAGSKAPDAFKISASVETFGNLLAIGGPSDLLYAADEGRVEELNSSSGKYEGEISLGELSSTETPSAVAVDPSGDVFVGDPASPGVHEYNSSKQLQSQAIGPAGASTQVLGLALDAYGRLGILSLEQAGGSREISGLLYSTSGTKLSSFAPPGGAIAESHSLAFASASAPLPDQLYVLESQGRRQEVEGYEPVVAPTALTCPLAEPPSATSATLCGEVNPNEVQTTGFFEYGSTPALGSQTASAFEGSGNALEPMSFEVTELEPNETYYYAAAAETTVNGRKILVTGETEQFATPIVSQRIVGSPQASAVALQSAVLSGSLNPEHTSTAYHFEYGPCAALSGCASVQSTPAHESSAYGVVEDIQEVTGLAEATTYSYRLVTEREGESPIVGPEGTFTTASMPVLKATTGSAENVTATSATITGSVDPGGKTASYSLEMGIYDGASTQFATVATGSAGSTPTSESAALSGLLPGVTYAYRITVVSAYGSATSVPSTFSTAGLAVLLTEPTPLAMLAVPKVTFPKLAVKPQTKRRHGFKRNKKSRRRVKIKRHHIEKRRQRHKKK